MKRLFETSFYLFPYEQVRVGSEIIIYGCGKIGRQYIQQIRNNNFCSIRDIVDENWKHVSQDFKVHSPENIVYSRDVTVVISMLDQSAIEQAIVLLNNHGFSKKQIITSHNKISVLNTVSSDDFGTKVETYSRDEAIAMFGTGFFDRWNMIVDYTRIVSVNNYNLVRIGKLNDGGYVMLDDLQNNRSHMAYSFGISNDVSWDSDMADHGFQVYMYDHTIDDIPIHRNEFHFFKIGVSDDEANKEDNNLKSLGQIVKENDHSEISHMILKMDIEGAEYGVINNIETDLLKCFDQIVIELHKLNDAGMQDTILKALEKISSEFAVVHIHANNYGDIIYVDDIPYPSTLEITFVNRKEYELNELDEVDLPINVDMPCWATNEEIVLGDWNGR